MGIRFIALLVFVALATWSAGNSYALGTAPGDIIATIIGLRGEVEVYVNQKVENEWWEETRVRKWVPAKLGHALRLEDSIRTGRGRVRFEFADRDERSKTGPSVFNLGDHTEAHLADFNVRFEETGKRGRIELIRGTIRSFIKGWGAQSGFSVRAGVAVCGARGTDFTVIYNPEEEAVEVQVHDGEVVLTGPGGSQLIKTGQSATMVNGGFTGDAPT